MKSLIPVLGAIVLLAGCTLGPKYSRPQVAVPAAHRAQEAAPAQPAADASLGEAKWWTVFADEELQKLIRTALAENLDLRRAASRIAQAQAQVGITRADQFPSINGTGGVARQRNPSNPVFPAFEANMSQLGLSSVWQLDFWGRYRKASEAARAEMMASEWNRRAVAATLVANVASGYFRLRELDLEMEIARRTLAARKESLELNQTLERGGAIPALDVHQAEVLVEQAARRIPDLARRIAMEENLLSTLIGHNPEAIPRGKPLVEQPVPGVVPAGIPSALLERRPDIRRAELQLIAANARIGVAKAAMFPQISLTGTAGFQAYSVTGLFDSKVYNVGASLTQPIFDLGRNRANVRLTEAQKEELVLSYQQSVQEAFREVADALTAVTRSRELRERQESLRAAAGKASALSSIRYKGGATSYLEVLRSETDLFEAEIQLAQAQLQERLAYVQIYSALGGGWEQ